jgi:hypothetical protein
MRLGNTILPVIHMIDSIVVISRFDSSVILMISAIVLIVVFILTLVFGIVRIVKLASHQYVQATTMNEPDMFSLMENITKLIVELLAILFAILATFVLFRYIKRKVAAVPKRHESTVVAN